MIKLLHSSDLIFIVVGSVHLGLGWVGLNYHLGYWGASGLVALPLIISLTMLGRGALVFATENPLLFSLGKVTFGFCTVIIALGIFSGVAQVLNWPWWAGVLVAVPSLITVPVAMSFMSLTVVVVTLVTIFWAIGLWDSVFEIAKNLNW